MRSGRTIESQMSVARITRGHAMNQPPKSLAVRFAPQRQFRGVSPFAGPDQRRQPEARAFHLLGAEGAVGVGVVVEQLPQCLPAALSQSVCSLDVGKEAPQYPRQFAGCDGLKFRRFVGLDFGFGFRGPIAGGG